jgi:hypothetical protein
MSTVESSGSALSRQRPETVTSGPRGWLLCGLSSPCPLSASPSSPTQNQKHRESSPGHRRLGECCRRSFSRSLPDALLTFMSCSAVASDGIAPRFPTPSRAGPSAEEEVSARAGCSLSVPTGVVGETLPNNDRRVQKVPLAAELLDSKKARYCLEVEIGKSPPLCDDDVWYEPQKKMLNTIAFLSSHYFL